jgi:hypothetical protein
MDEILEKHHLPKGTHSVEEVQFCSCEYSLLHVTPNLTNNLSNYPEVLDHSSDEPRTWFSVINESIHTSDDQDIGDVHRVSRHFKVVKRGIVNVHYYYIPVNKIEDWDGHILCLRISEDQVNVNMKGIQLQILQPII